MLKRIWELHRTMILVGLFGLGVGTWLSADSGSFKGVILAKDGESLTVYKSTGEVVVLSSSLEFHRGQIVMKRPASRAAMAQILRWMPRCVCS